MKIGIIGAGSIGKTLALKLAAAGHDVKVAHSGDPNSMPQGVLSTGAKAGWTKDVVKGVDVLILSIPLLSIPDVAPLVSALPTETLIIDTSNYFPFRDTHIDAIDNGQVESEWIEQQLGRPIVKAWNNILAETLAVGNLPKGDPKRLAVAVAADTEQSFKVAAELVEITGFDAIHSGTTAESWRHQPGSPAYCTGMNKEEMLEALHAAERALLPERRDISIAAVMERVKGGAPFPSARKITQINRAIYIP